MDLAQTVAVGYGGHTYTTIHELLLHAPVPLNVTELSWIVTNNDDTFLLKDVFTPMHNKRTVTFGLNKPVKLLAVFIVPKFHTHLRGQIMQQI